MEINDLINKIIEVEEKFNPVITVLEEKSKEKDFNYRKLYKGIISIQSKISFQPEILFLGINPGEGAFIQKNYKEGNTFYYPKELVSQNKKLELNWLQDDNARQGKWYNGKVKNLFPKQMIDILFYISQNKFKKDLNLFDEDNRRLFITEIADKIVYTNLCPIATKSTKELKTIYKKLSDEESLKNHWNGTVQNFFRQRTIDLILALQPKLIVCVGNSVYKDLFLKDTSKKDKVFSTISVLKREGSEYPFKTIVFSRKGTWDTKKISELIIKAEN